MELHLTLIFFIAFAQGIMGARHVVYWDRKLIPRLADGGLEITLEVDDWMDILCPYAASYEGRHFATVNSIYLQLFNVTRDEYLSCDTRGGIRLQTCDSPMIEKKLTTKFQERSPYPFGFTFIPGATYYYISKPLHDASKGCTPDTMRMKVHVKRKGNVFHRNEHERTRTYHQTGEETSQEKHESNLIPNLKPAPKQTPNRHHHHERATPPTTRHPKVIIQFETQPVHHKTAKVSAIQQDDPENAASSLGRHWTMSIFLSFIIYFLLSIFLSYCEELQ